MASNRIGKVRAWRAPCAFDPARTLNWLRKRVAFRGGHGESGERDLRQAMRETPERARAIADYFFRTLVVDDSRWLALTRFREAILYELSANALLNIIIEHMEAAEPGAEKQIFLYEAGLFLSYQAEQPYAGAIFDRLFAMADSKPFLCEARARSATLMLPAGYFDGRTRRTVEAEEGRQRQRQEFEQDEERIRTGAHLGWIAHLGQIYFAWYSDVDRSLSPRQRLAAWLGRAKVETGPRGSSGRPVAQRYPQISGCRCDDRRPPTL